MRHEKINVPLSARQTVSRQEVTLVLYHLPAQTGSASFSTHLTHFSPSFSSSVCDFFLPSYFLVILFSVSKSFFLYFQPFLFPYLSPLRFLLSKHFIIILFCVHFLFNSASYSSFFTYGRESTLISPFSMGR